MTPLLAVLACLPGFSVDLGPYAEPPGWEGAPLSWAELYARAEDFEALTTRVTQGLPQHCVRAHVLVHLAEQRGQPSLVLDALEREVRLRCGPTGGHVAEVLAREVAP